MGKGAHDRPGSGGGTNDDHSPLVRLSARKRTGVARQAMRHRVYTRLAGGRKAFVTSRTLLLRGGRRPAG